MNHRHRIALKIDHRWGLYCIHCSVCIRISLIRRKHSPAEIFWRGGNILKWGKIFSISARWHTQTHMDRQQKHFCLEYKWNKNQTKKSIKSSNQRLISDIKGWKKVGEHYPGNLKYLEADRIRSFVSKSHQQRVQTKSGQKVEKLLSGEGALLRNVFPPSTFYRDL